MAKLIAKTPCYGLLPISAGTVTLTELHPISITSIAPVTGRAQAVSQSLFKACGLKFPVANRATGREGQRCIWFGHENAVLLGQAIENLSDATIVDLSDGWAVMRLEGEKCEAVLARLVPVNLHSSTFKRGHTARSLLGHMSVSITRTGKRTFDLMVFRSMAHTAVHELTRAMQSIAAQN